MDGSCFEESDLVPIPKDTMHGLLFPCNAFIKAAAEEG